MAGTSLNAMLADLQSPLITLIRELYKGYATDHDLDTQQMQRILMKDFVAYSLKATDWYHNAKVRDKMRQALRLDDACIEQAWAILNDPWEAMPLLHSIWPLLSLAGRPRPQQRLVTTDVMVTLMWQADKESEPRVAQLRVPSDWSDLPGITDGSVMTILKEQTARLLVELALHGLDGLHAQEAVTVPRASTDG